MYTHYCQITDLIQILPIVSVSKEKHFCPGPGSSSGSRIAFSFRVSFPFMTLTFVQSTGQLLGTVSLRWVCLRFPPD